MKSSVSILCVAAFLAGCSAEPNEDLKQWVKESDQKVSQKIEPLPEVAPYQAFTYAAEDMFEPFKPRKLTDKQKKEGENKGPDLNRRKELLESYPLDQLKFVGTMEKAKTHYALIRADQTVHRVKAGNFLGQNFGQIVVINDTEVTLKESIQDSEGEWKESDAALQLIDEMEKK
jgi:type IV pilus assembly protein PilP